MANVNKAVVHILHYLTTYVHSTFEPFVVTMEQDFYYKLMGDGDVTTNVVGRRCRKSRASCPYALVASGFNIFGSISDDQTFFQFNLSCEPDLSRLSFAPAGSSQHPDIRGLSAPNSPSCNASTFTTHCSGNSEPVLDMPLNINLNSSFSSSYHAVISPPTGLPMWSHLFMRLVPLSSIIPPLHLPRGDAILSTIRPN